MILETHAVEDSFESVGRQINEIMDEMTRRSYYRFSRSAAWEPAMNILEDEGHLYLCVELAGLAKEAIVVEVEGSRLRIRGDRPVPQPPHGESPTCIVHMEINSGTFERTIELPERADTTSMDARLESGFLWITVGKKPA